MKKAKKEKPEQQPQQPDTAPEQPKEEAKQDGQREQDDQVKQLTEENAQLKDQLLRKMAEFDNFRKRTAREKEELADYFINDFFEILRNEDAAGLFANQP